MSYGEHLVSYLRFIHIFLVAILGLQDETP